MANPKASVLIQLIDKVSGPLKTIRGKIGDFSKGVVSGATKIAALGASITGLGAIFTSAAGKVEQWQVRFETMAGSAEKGQAVLAELTELASKSPFDMPQVVEGAARLNAMGFETEELAERMRMLGDITAGVGSEKMPQLVLAFGQVRTAGKLTGQELRQFNEAGVDLLGGLAENLGKTKAEIKDMVSEGKIGFDDVDQTLKNMTSSGGQFFGLMDKLSGTFLGKVSNIKDNLFQMSVAIGNELLPEVAGLTDGVAKFTENEENVLKISSRFQDLLIFVKSLIVWIQNAGDTINQWYLSVSGSVTNVQQAFSSMFIAVENFLRSFVTGSVEIVNNWINTIINGVNKITSKFGKSFDEIDLKQSAFYKSMMNSSNSFLESETNNLNELEKKSAENKRKILELEVNKTKRIMELQDEIQNKAEQIEERRVEINEKANNEIVDSTESAADEIDNSLVQSILNIANASTESFDEVKNGLDDIKSEAKAAAGLLDSLVFGGTLEDKVLKAERDFSRKKRDIEKAFSRGEITEESKFKKLRNATEDYTDKISDLKEEALQASKVKFSDVLDPAGAAGRIFDANNSLSKTKSILNNIKNDAEDYHAAMHNAANRAAQEESNSGLTTNTAYTTQSGPSIQTTPTITASSEEMSNSGLTTNTALTTQRTPSMQTTPTTTASNDVMVTLLNTLNKLDAKLDNLSVNVDVNQVSTSITKTIDEYQTLNSKGRI